MKKVIQQLDLDNPAHAHKFLRGVKIQGKRLHSIILESGYHLLIEDMTDEQACRYSKDVWLDSCGGEEGKPGMVELEGVDQ